MSENLVSDLLVHLNFRDGGFGHCLKCFELMDRSQKEISHLTQELENAHREGEEQARLLGKSGSREAKLISEFEAARGETVKAQKAAIDLAKESSRLETLCRELAAALETKCEMSFECQNEKCGHGSICPDCQQVIDAFAKYQAHFSGRERE